MDPNAPTAPGQPAKGKTSPWVYVGCGCALALLLAGLAVLFVGRKLVDQGHKMEQGMTDPKVREQRTRELLVYSELPEGYYAAGGLSVPFLIDMAFLGDHPPAPGDTHVAFDDHGYMFMKMHWGKVPTDPEGRRRMLHGARGQAPWERGSGLRLDSHEALGEGEVTAGGANVSWRTVRGDIHMNGRRQRGITSLELIDCPDHRLRMGIWFTRDPAPEQPTATLDKTGTPADPRAIAAFLDHFKLCAGSGAG
jgi:hypothetical protein